MVCAKPFGGLPGKLNLSSLPILFSLPTQYHSLHPLFRKTICAESRVHEILKSNFGEIQ